MITDPTFVTNLIIRVMTDDPSKVIECIEGAEGMIACGADMGTSRHQLMAEEATHWIVKMNPHLDGLAETITEHDDAINAALAAHFETMGW